MAEKFCFLEYVKNNINKWFISESGTTNSNQKQADSKNWLMNPKKLWNFMGDSGTNVGLNGYFCYEANELKLWIIWKMQKIIESNIILL